MRILNLHVVYGDLGIIYYKITYQKSLSLITQDEFQILEKIFYFSGHRYLEKTSKIPETSFLKISPIKIPNSYCGQFNGVDINDTIEIAYVHETGDMKLIKFPIYKHNYNQVEIDYFLDEKIKFFLD